MKLRDRLLHGANVKSSLAAESVRGDAIEAAEAIGAVVEEHQGGNFFWQPYSSVPRVAGNPGRFPHLFLDRAKPGLIAVNRHGMRFTNEADSYHHFVAEMLKSDQDRDGKFWLVCDAAFITRYGLGVVPPGTTSLMKWEKNGYLFTAPTIDVLAVKIHVSPTELSRTVDETNSMAKAGVDSKFGKGSTELNLFNGDASHKPNPCLGPIEVPPYVALEIHAGDAAFSAGLAVDENGRVLNGLGAAIEGLYACGNDAASMMRGAYPGPGATLGPAIVFAYRVASEISRDSSS